MPIRGRLAKGLLRRGRMALHRATRTNTHALALGARIGRRAALGCVAPPRLYSNPPVGWTSPRGLTAPSGSSVIRKNWCSVREIRANRPGRMHIVMLIAGLCALLGPGAQPAFAQAEPADGVPIKRVEVKGLESMSEGFVRRTVKTRESQPFERNQVQEDVRELLRTRKFLDVRAEMR